MAPQDPAPRIAILLSTYNGARWLREQLESILHQTHEEWVLYWRDDGSADASVAILQEFSQRAGQGRCVRIEQPAHRLGVTASFLTLLRAVVPRLGERDAIAFADQDDIWLPHKLERGLAALHRAGQGLPVLYCGRQILVDQDLNRLGLSGALRRATGFPAALTQNVATGCTVMLNRQAACLVAASRPAPGTLHDWWAYLMVTAAGGLLVQDKEPVILYRQHRCNLVGAPASSLRRAVGALRRGPALFMTLLRAHVDGLLAQPELITERARAELLLLSRALHGGIRLRLMALRMPGLHRQTWPETALFRCWFLIG
ncbi:Glycosyltransferase family 2 protein [Rhodovastum atsumiense]|uniref:Glycosyltransferase family 2 protein n=1 Tax=Rhodovastum atsumiense TaxID=504468 RepID=A0A5M6IYP6_9PROT|nr:glycosyltransferase family 2 protein [Rhodovastum atsumiense]KAA5612937.1 glycosyltransferase family 2 protein [Rhodovastum atsumiense]CAH2600975.1 Glycosyltransferase family 2 protein [Rhodovastum atsumiense]